jgi:hypothetical protein
LSVRFRDLVVASKNLFVSFRSSFVNFQDLLIIFKPTNRININNRPLLPINKAPEVVGEDFYPFATCSLGLLSPLLYHFKVILLSLSSLALNLSGLSEPNTSLYPACPNPTPPFKIIYRKKGASALFFL